MRLDLGFGRNVLGCPMHGRHFPGAIPLNRQILVGNPGEDGRDLGRDRFLVAGPYTSQILGLGKVERPDDAVDHRHRYLETHALRNDALLAQGAEHEVR